MIFFFSQHHRQIKLTTAAQGMKMILHEGAKKQESTNINWVNSILGNHGPPRQLQEALDCCFLSSPVGLTSFVHNKLCYSVFLSQSWKMLPQARLGNFLWMLSWLQIGWLICISSSISYRSTVRWIVVFSWRTNSSACWCSLQGLTEQSDVFSTGNNLPDSLAHVG